MRLKDLGEFNFIDRVSKGLKVSKKVIKGIGDDTAVLEFKKDTFLLFTTDMLVEGVHFTKRDKFHLVGKKSVLCSVSDIAAMGGIPKSFVVSLGLPSRLDVRAVDNLYRGIREAQRDFRLDLVGGDTVRSKKIIINIALLGEVEKKNLVLRSGAKNGDLVFVTGSLGGSIKGRHLNFTPRVKEARFLVKNFRINSMIDLSDGLLADLGHILKESSLGAVIYEESIPVSRDARDFNSAIKDGEDFELAFTVPKRQAERLKKTWPFRTPLSEVGRICRAQKGLYLVRENGKKEKVRPEGYSHF